MKIVVLFGSPNQFGSTNLIVQAFKNGAQKNGHEVEVVDVTKLNIGACGGCVACGYEGPCVKNDDMQFVKEKLLGANMVVFATPLYYFGMTAQLKIVVDRFCSFNSSLNFKHLKSALLSVAWNTNNWTFDALKLHYQTLVKYLNFNDVGSVLGYGCGTPQTTASSKYVEMAYNLGNSL